MDGLRINKKNNGNKCMMLKLPQFLVISLEEELLGRCKIEDELKLIDDARGEKGVTYTFSGFISKTGFHYSYFRKESEMEFTHFNDSTVEVKILCQPDV